MVNLERELGVERYKIVISPALDPFEKNREAALEMPNGCRVHCWDHTFEETGKQLFYAQVWLPERKKPILNVRKGYEAATIREQEIASALAAFNSRNGVELKVVNEASDPIDAPDFDPASFT